MIVGFFPQLLLSLWKHECKRVIADRFTKPEDVEWFDQTLATLVGEEMGDEHKGMVDLGADRYFVDFLRDAPEATGADRATFERNETVVIACVCSSRFVLFSSRGRAGRVRLGFAQGVRANGVV